MIWLGTIAGLLACGASAWGMGAPQIKELRVPTQATDLSLRGTIEGRNIQFTMTFDIDPQKAHERITLLKGDMVVLDTAGTTAGHDLRFDVEKREYSIGWPTTGRKQATVTFAVRPMETDGGAWREVWFEMPASRVRQLEVTCDRTDLQVQFPDALRVQRQVLEGKLVLTAMLGPGRPFVVRWQPRVQELDAKLVVASEANTIATVSAGAMRIDSLFNYDIAQGKLESLSFALPASLSVTQVRGGDIRDWRIEAGEEGGPQRLIVTLARPQTRQYAVQVVGEMSLGSFPIASLDVPVIAPAEGVRHSGHVAVGTDSAIALVVDQSSGLSQIDAAAFPRYLLESQSPRSLPQANAFYYGFPAAPYSLRIRLDDVVPSYDATHRLAVQVKEEDAVVLADVELDVRQAPIRRVVIDVPAGYMVAAAGGQMVEDYTVADAAAAEGGGRSVQVQFREPVMGRTVVGLRLELGRSPLGQSVSITAPKVRGAKTQRGYLVVAAEPSVLLGTPTVTNLREVNTASIELRIPDAQQAWRFREADWSLAMDVQRKPSGVRVEAFELASIGEGVCYGTAAFSYYISGAPIDELKFRVPAAIGGDIEFVGVDVRRWDKQGDIYTVKLGRKVVGDYNLGASWTQRYDEAGAVVVGAISAQEVDTQTGYLVVASHLNLKLTDASGDLPQGMLAIDRDELPAGYKLQIRAPVLRTYKYLGAEHQRTIGIEPYERGELLPVVVELMDLHTDLGVREQGEVETITRVRYKIKNTSSQFLALKMPKDAMVWSTHVIERDEQGQEVRTRVVASEDTQRGLLMAPLKRYRDPNAPITIEIQYAESHGTLSGWTGRASLTAPQSLVQSTFAHWTVAAPPKWALHAAGGNMQVDEQSRTLGDLSLVLRHVGGAWNHALDRVFESYAAGWIALGAVGVVMLALFVRRSVVPSLIVALVIGAVTAIGAIAADTMPFRQAFLTPHDAQPVQFAQSLTLSDEEPLTISVGIVPAWARDATWASAVVVPLIGAACIVVGLIARRVRPLLLAAGGAAFVYAAARFPDASPALGHLLTWGVPGAALLFVVAKASWRWWMTPRPAPAPQPAAAAAGAALIAALLVFGASGASAQQSVGAPPSAERPAQEPPSQPPAPAPAAAPAPEPPPPPPFVLDDLRLTLAAEQDSMAADYRVAFTAKKAMSFRLIDAAAIMLSPGAPAEHVRVVLEDGGYVVHALAAGQFTVDLKFLLPLAPADEQQRRAFELAVPRSLTNRVSLTIPRTGLEVEAPTAIHLRTQEADDATRVEAVFGPLDAVRFTWQPRLRQTKLEKTQFFSDVTTAVRFDAALIESRHLVQLQIAQGELRDIRVRVPQGMIVTTVDGANIGAWRFDPATQLLEARLAAGVSGQYAMLIITQRSADALPYEATVGQVRVLDAERQRGTLGLVASSAVYLDVPPQAMQSMNVDDFIRDAAEVLVARQGVETSTLRHAYRVLDPDQMVSLSVSEVKPELRTSESAVFSVADDRLVYNGQWAVSVSKAGVFSFEVIVPAEYDIDALDAGGVSHWDETVQGDGTRRVQVHFAQRLLGEASLKLDLSRPVTDLPGSLAVPRVTVAGAVKHAGQVVVTAAQGVRLTASQRQGVSELNPLELNIRTPGAMAFRLLRPDWDVTLATEVIAPRINVDFLHVAQVSEGMVRHTHYLRYKLLNAGVKVFDLQAPADALGMTITGPDIAHVKPVEGSPGRWRVELSRKYLNQPYPMTVRYERRFDMAAGQPVIQSVQAIGADLRQGHVVVNTTSKVQIDAQQADASLIAADARAITTAFGAGDLSDAALSYFAGNDAYTLTLRARRHAAAELLEAQVEQAAVLTVVNEQGESIHQVQMRLRVGGKRYLEARLPAGATVWALAINRRSTVPSTRQADKGEQALLIPLAQAASGELPVFVDLIYVLPAPAGWSNRSHIHTGPRFDLPLRNVKWVFFLPESFDYDDFTGTMTVNDQTVRDVIVERYDLGAYEQEQTITVTEDQRIAATNNDLGRQLAQQGSQYAARQALENAYNYSFSDIGLNEDVRIQLHKLMRQQTMVGLKGRRAYLRPPTESGEGGAVRDLGDEFTAAAAEQELNDLAEADSRNLQQIAERMIEAQEAAVAPTAQLMIHVPLRGRVIEFDRAVQVQPLSEMRVSFSAAPKWSPVRTAGMIGAGGLFAAFAVLLFILPRIERKVAIVSPAAG